jgi:ketosteroid isomerase-like protein
MTLPRTFKWCATCTRRFARSWPSSHDSFSLEATRWRSVGHTRCRVKSTAKMYETDFVHVVTFKQGQIARFQEFFDTFAAAEAFR